MKMNEAIAVIASKTPWGFLFKACVIAALIYVLMPKCNYIRLHGLADSSSFLRINSITNHAELCWVVFPDKRTRLGGPIAGCFPLDVAERNRVLSEKEIEEETEKEYAGYAKEMAKCFDKKTKNWKPNCP